MITAPYDGPESLDISVENDTCLVLEWSEPTQPNGVITNYTVSITLYRYLYFLCLYESLNYVTSIKQLFNIVVLDRNGRFVIFLLPAYSLHIT